MIVKKRVRGESTVSDRLTSFTEKLRSLDVIVEEVETFDHSATVYAKENRNNNGSEDYSLILTQCLEENNMRISELEYSCRDDSIISEYHLKF